MVAGKSRGVVDFGAGADPSRNNWEGPCRAAFCIHHNVTEVKRVSLSLLQAGSGQGLAWRAEALYPHKICLLQQLFFCRWSRVFTGEAINTRLKENREKHCSWEIRPNSFSFRSGKLQSVLSYQRTRICAKPLVLHAGFCCGRTGCAIKASFCIWNTMLKE